jgi:hypothetical protein
VVWDGISWLAFVNTVMELPSSLIKKARISAVAKGRVVSREALALYSLIQYSLAHPLSYETMFLLLM